MFGIILFVIFIIIKSLFIVKFLQDIDKDNKKLHQNFFYPNKKKNARK